MLALILAGGSGTRLNMGEKPLVDICGHPMIRYVIRAFRDFGAEPLVVLSRLTPYTRNWCLANGVDHFVAGSGDYLGDIVEAVNGLGETGPVMISACDLPGIDGDILRVIWAEYQKALLPALSTWVPLSLCEMYGCRPGCMERIQGTDAAPAGVNILMGDRIEWVQEEYRLLFRDWRMALNVNTRESLDAARRMIAPGISAGCHGP
jgi:adenosylcobinamide-phosphate guanylyltransferase